MNQSLRISLLVHGFPPYENAGTEQHTASLHTALIRAGHQVQVISATRSPLHAHGTVLSTSPHIHRIVNNIPARPLRDCERDPIMKNCIEELWTQFSPQIIHIQHIQFLSSDLLFPCPTIITLHDAWLWCAAGGQERLHTKEVCLGANPKTCAICSHNWSPQLPKRGKLLISIAQILHPMISVERLNHLWKLIPISVRHSFSQTTKRSPIPSSKDAQNRNAQLNSLASRCSFRISPSEYLAKRAEKHGIHPIQVIRHGVQKHHKHIGGSGFVFVGTIAPHKGPHLVYEAHKSSQVAHIPLKFYGPMMSPELIPKEVWYGTKNNEEIIDILQKADALIMGSIWPENAPLVIIEAHSVGCPVIAPRIGGIPELIQNNETGILYEPGNTNDLREALHAILNLPPFHYRPPLFSEILHQYINVYKQLL